jgi:hypothetical protein
VELGYVSRRELAKLLAEQQDGCRLCVEGVTTLDEVRRVAGDRPF